MNKPEKIIRVDEVKDLEKFKQYILELKEKYYIKVATGKPSEDSDIEKAMRNCTYFCGFTPEYAV